MAEHRPARPTVRRVLLIVGGGIAAYKALELVRLMRKAGLEVRAILTRSGAEFVTPLSLAALTGSAVRQDLFSSEDETTMGHIELSRWADLIVVAPATAGLMAKAATGAADDLASTTLLATDAPVLLAPAMNVRMWLHPAVQANLATLQAFAEPRYTVVGPDDGEMACGEYGPGRMAEPSAILDAILAHDGKAGLLERPLVGRHALVTAGPTFEPIDPVRGLTNRSSGKQGYAIASALARAGARVTLVSGPVALDAPAGVDRVSVETAEQMLAAVETALPADLAILTAAVSDWRVAGAADTKIKKQAGEGPPALSLVETPDILRALSNRTTDRPALVIGFAAETGQLEARAAAKLEAKSCDWIVGNDVSEGVFGRDETQVVLFRKGAAPEPWPETAKTAVADRLVHAVVDHFSKEAP
ncbi:MAG: bifunctional phosphopantothenoylcysteine decarboxylase/phosphopantothenate--cysteine ligase CoaBC [Brevundimonas sp.]|uniref:bifunctional phosphopantothenoylcysteine decarboxylase/phosphopantothenate--cysteine ligase CoaBC n=1 Tax=Brevundimonas sp. TaxID=1871086 RepID=UPI002732DFD7|nr:bifunctional phosphopantothenoylcysteine decarboxylase/phosphopantothenate--cysteine ligase CoaBC [Brevundimonas sp.]MDP3379336.1 bifunctional phosphopantothenoylcysteine decarboxylase/phosphopantothenate--cysteine ligase CoaBC [Brevundimonas sp.]